MIGLTDRETALAVAAGGPAAGFSLALAEMGLYWDNHAEGAPAPGPFTITIEPGGDSREQAAAVAAVADWLGVPLTSLDGTNRAARRFGPPGHAVTVEARCAAGRPAA
jgi:hypothetical protein